MSLSDHNYILFAMNPVNPAKADATDKWTSRKINCSVLEAALKTVNLDIDTNIYQADEYATFLTNIQGICKRITHTRPSVVIGNLCTSGHRR